MSPRVRVSTGVAGGARGDVNAGRDPQLERAVQEGLRLLQAQSGPRLVEPAPPVRAKRP